MKLLNIDICDNMGKIVYTGPAFRNRDGEFWIHPQHYEYYASTQREALKMDVGGNPWLDAELDI